jgi:3-hydroxyisobutyrate dehydrogenase
MNDGAIGFIGLGVMGAPMATHLANAGYRLTIHDANPAVSTALLPSLKGRAVVAATPREVAAASTIIVTMLPDGKVVQEVATGEQGLAGGLRPGSLLLDTSSAEPWLTLQTAQILAERGAGMVDAPVSGARHGAETADLVFMVGATDADLARVRPLLDVMGNNVFHLGGVGAGHAMKCINNCITAVTLTATTEGLISGRRYGLDSKAMVDVLNMSTGGSWISKSQFEQRIFNREFDDPFKLDLMLKDIGIAIDLAKTTHVPMPTTALVQQLWRMASHAAGAGASISEFVRWLENQSGTPLGATPHGSTNATRKLP